MADNPLAGQPAPASLLIHVEQLRSQYYRTHPDPANPDQQVTFGTSGHRGTSGAGTFNEDHILAIVQAIVDYRNSQRTRGPLFMGIDTHALSAPAQETALEVLGAARVEVYIAKGADYTPTPVISNAILTHNRSNAGGPADGIILTPSHNPPQDGGIKYNPPTGGPADTAATTWIQNRANALLARDNRDVKRIPIDTAMRLASTHRHDYITPYVKDLASIVDMDIIRKSGLRIGVDPLGGSSIHYWAPIAAEYGIDLRIVNEVVDPTFRFMHVDHDGKIRMDCSSPSAMAGLVLLRDRFDIAFGNDPDADRHGIVTRSGGLMNPNHYLAAAIDYLFTSRRDWRDTCAVGKTIVSSAIIDRVAAGLNRPLREVPVGFKWFVDGLLDGSYGFGGEESAGASFLRHDGHAWSTDKDGIIMGLLAAEITARTGRDPAQMYARLTEKYGNPIYSRVDHPADRTARDTLKKLSADAVEASMLAGDAITAKLTRAPANDAEIGGLKVTTERGWFAARPSGTEDIYKIYAESFVDEVHLSRIMQEAQEIVSKALPAGSTPAV